MLDESQTGIKITREISTASCADDATVMAESKEESKSLWMRVKEESEKAGLQLSIKHTHTHTHTKIMAFSSITSWQIDRGISGNSHGFYVHGLQNHCR